MTGAGSLSPEPQPVTETASALLLLGALRGVPAERGVPATGTPARGKAFPLYIISFRPTFRRGRMFDLSWINLIVGFLFDPLWE